MPFQIADLIDGHYRVEQRFAGGMGFVYVVLDEVVGKRFAIKQLAEIHAANEILLERFRREASTWLQLEHHPNIVQAYSYLPRADAPMLILEYVDGPSLELLLKSEKRLTPVQMLRYAKQICQAMMHAHAREIVGRGTGVLHRDIKPANIMLTRTNQVKITDFGLAKIQGDAQITTHGQFVGTVAYSSPEQLRGAGDVTPASDVYSVGAVMYQAISGHAPFKGANAAELFYAIQETEPPPVGDFVPELNAAFANIIMRCLKKSPEERISSFQQLDAAVSELVELAPEPTDQECAQCRFVSRQKATKCSVCGRATADPRAKVRFPLRMWKCVCGSAVPLSVEKCPKCGREHEPPPSAPEPARALPDAEQSAVPLPIMPDSSPAVMGTVRTVWDLDEAEEYLVELRSGGFVLPWQLKRSGYTVGRDPNMKIRLDDPTVARYHMFIVRLPCGWLAMNPVPSQVMEVNGWRTRQQVLKCADLVRLGGTWLAYAGPRDADALAPLPGRWAERIGPKALTVKSGGSSATQVHSAAASSCTLEIAGGVKYISSGQPLRIGTSPLCEARITDHGVAPIQALLTWQADGPHLINVTEGLVRTMEGEVFSDRLLENGDLLQIGSTPIRARVLGDPRLPGRLIAEAVRATAPRLAVTILTGDQRGQTAIIPCGQPVVLGRLPGSDLIISSDPYVSRRHLELVATESDLNIKDVGRRSGFFVNQTHFTEEGVVRLGDVLVVGKTSMLVHYELETD